MPPFNGLVVYLFSGGTVCQFWKFGSHVSALNSPWTTSVFIIELSNNVIVSGNNCSGVNLSFDNFYLTVNTTDNSSVSKSFVIL